MMSPTYAARRFIRRFLAILGSLRRRLTVQMMAVGLILVCANAVGQTRIAVSAFENKVKLPWWDPSWRVGDGLAEMLTTELVRTGRFVVVERAAIGEVIGEQALGQSGLVTRESAAPSGRLLGAQFTVRGAVTEIEEQASGFGGSLQDSRAALGARVSHGLVGLDLRVIDNATGQIVASRNVSARIPAAAGALSTNSRSVAIGVEGFFQTPIGQATRAAIQQAVALVVASTPAIEVARRMLLVKVEGDLVYVNAGSNAALRVGQTLRVFGSGEALIDPATGMRLGAVERLAGAIEITEVHEQFAIGRIRAPASPMKRGDVVRPD